MERERQNQGKRHNQGFKYYVLFLKHDIGTEAFILFVFSKSVDVSKVLFHTYKMISHLKIK